MEKKRSVVVTIFGYLGIIIGIYSVIQELLITPPADLGRAILSLALIFLSFYLLRLRNWSRILLLILNCFEFVIATIIQLLMLFTLPWEKVVEIFIKTYPPRFTPVILIIGLIHHIYLISFLIFFTRPKVKAQFSPERGE